MTGLVIDNFAGGGGASTGIERALGRRIDVAINHDAEAVALHAANHPDTLHLCQNVWKADPREVVRQASAKRCHEQGVPMRELPVDLAWFSPDCKHFSKAKGSKPVEKGIRDLAWVVVHWAKLVKPAVIMLENVEEFRDWGPLVQTENGKLVPCPASKGFTFKRWRRELVKLGYKVEHRELRACDYGAPTIRKRLYVIARCDGLPIVWPEPTHAKVATPALKRYGWAADCIDWSLDCPSIFGRKKALAENTLRRIARGVVRFVINAAEPFIVGAGGPTYGGKPVGIHRPFGALTTENHRALVQPFVARIGQTGGGGKYVNGIDEPLTTITSKAEHLMVQPFVASLTHHGGERVHSVEEPFKTITAAHRGELALIAPHITKFRSGSDGHAADEPLHTVTANSFRKRPGGAAPLGVVAAFLAQHNTGVVGHDACKPLSTIVGTGSTQAAVECALSDEDQAGAGRVSAFLLKYYGQGIGQTCGEPMHAVTTRDRFALITVLGVPIVDIGMRMLQPRELYRAQGFPERYVIESDPDGRPFTKTAQVRMVGNSVCPPVAEALVRANMVRDVDLGERAAD